MALASVSLGDWRSVLEEEPGHVEVVHCMVELWSLFYCLFFGEKIDIIWCRPSAKDYYYYYGIFGVLLLF